MTDFLYWSGDRLDSSGSSRSDSPFWDAIQQVLADSQTLHVACPYLDPTYIQELIERVDEFRLVTDVQAWTRVYGGQKELEITDFVRTNAGQIRHYPGLHAKAVIGGEAAVFGSANLTRNGMIERQEIGMRLTEPELVGNLRGWFEDVWATGKKIDEGVLPETDESGSEGLYERTETDTDVFHRLAKAPNREWVESLLDVMRKAIQVTQLGEADPRLVTSVAQENRIVVMVNNRYVCGGFFDGGARVGFILADGLPGVDEAVRQSLRDEYYRFSTRDGRNPHWVEFDRYPGEALPEGVEPAWETAIENEVDRGTRSQYLDHHESRVYHLIVDDTYRDSVLKEVFQSEPP